MSLPPLCGNDVYLDGHGSLRALLGVWRTISPSKEQDYVYRRHTFVRSHLLRESFTLVAASSSLFMTLLLLLARKRYRYKSKHKELPKRCRVFISNFRFYISTKSFIPRNFFFSQHNFPNRMKINKKYRTNCYTILLVLQLRQMFQNDRSHTGRTFI